MERSPARCSLWMAASAAAVLATACTEEPDVVGYPLPLEAGPALDASTDASMDASMDAAVDERCEPKMRFMRARLPLQLVLDIYMMDCKIPLGDFMQRDGKQSSISATEFSTLLRAPEINPPEGTPAALLCDPERGGYYFEPWGPMPQRFVLCPATCDAVKTEIERVLSLDGCDPAFDDGGTP